MLLSPSTPQEQEEPQVSSEDGCYSAESPGVGPEVTQADAHSEPLGEGGGLTCQTFPWTGDEGGRQEGKKEKERERERKGRN